MNCFGFVGEFFGVGVGVLGQGFNGVFEDVVCDFVVSRLGGEHIFG